MKRVNSPSMLAMLRKVLTDNRSSPLTGRWWELDQTLAPISQMIEQADPTGHSVS